MNRQQLEAYISETYNAEPEHPWAPETDHTVFRHANNRKWFAAVMEIPKSKLGIDEDGKICIVNLKCDPAMIGSLLPEEGIFPAWHMNKAHWISVAPECIADEERLRFLLDLSYELTSMKIKKKRTDNYSVHKEKAT